ncbi:glycosyltransferase [Flavobacteriaceae bacterium]|nr:glycosyltransferase [Flavobacteriaceae bacterium]
MKNPVLSIIVPIYNVEEFLEECIESILNQSFKDFELILVNDGSTDRCPEICDDYAIRDQRVIVINKINGGLSSARNAGIDAAKGSYLSFVDSDDFISSDYYEKNINYLLTHPNTNILVLQVCYYDNIQNIVIPNKSRKLLNKEDIINYMMSKDYVGSAWISIYKKEIFDNLRYPEGKIFEDGFILIDIIENANHVFISDIGTYYYRKRYGSIMLKKKNLKDWYDILTTHSKQLDFCYSISDNKKLFIAKYERCHLALIYALIEYPNESFKVFKTKFEQYNYSFLQLYNVVNTKSMIKLYILKLFGFSFMVKLYKSINIYKVNI